MAVQGAVQTCHLGPLLGRLRGMLGYSVFCESGVVFRVCHSRFSGRLDVGGLHNLTDEREV
jgi:hypothetical protein